ncbi:topoisomerase C-terminal repeat-containing protein [Kibdelosporangium lantanae]|uniref:Topoisomerase C-terminal repeat-containing protein n=1 Tax=Kibdelosporangium lantanae TaxID=1497396 RepID=A0ABW3M6L4_9PSEU
MREWSLARRLLVLQVAIVAVVVGGGSILAYLDAARNTEDSARREVVAVAYAIAAAPTIVSALDTPRPAETIQPFAERARTTAGVDFVTIMSRDGIRFSHPNPAEIGGHFLGHTEEALAGGTVLETYTGTLGPSIRAVVPVFSATHQVVAMVSVGITVNTIAEELFSVPQEGRTLGTDPVTGHEIVAKDGRFGPYVTEILPEENGNKKVKPRTGSLFKSMTIADMTLDDALKLLSLPRVVGTDPQSGEEITAQNGRYGPYLKKGTDSRSLTTEDQIFNVTLDEALKIYAEPKKRGRAAANAAPPLKELGNDPVSGKPMIVKDGRFGPYVTDGEYNASLRKSDSVDTLTDERAAELLQEKRDKGPAPKKAPARKTATKSTAAKKTTAAKKPAAKRTAAKAK